MSTANRIEIGARIRAARENRGLTQRALSTQLDMPEKVISRLENGHSPQSSAVLSRLAEALGVPVGYFFGEAAPEAEAADLTDWMATYRQLSPELRKAVQRFAESLASTDE